ncbi:MAG: hypothetical protein JRJ45_00415 [Deltaproteobacteria bacterium]|nr:hypothetical protein [Deltaproteobacteria bacterium]
MKKEEMIGIINALYNGDPVERIPIGHPNNSDWKITTATNPNFAAYRYRRKQMPIEGWMAKYYNGEGSQPIYATKDVALRAAAFGNSQPGRPLIHMRQVIDDEA